MIVQTKAYTRAGLAGNPSDGYFGKTLSVTFKDFYAQVTMYETPDLEILPNDRDHSYFEDFNHLVKDVQRHGYYGGIRLIKAAAKNSTTIAVKKGLCWQIKTLPYAIIQTYLFRLVWPDPAPLSQQPFGR